MTIDIPENRKEVSDRMKTDVQSQLPSSNPFLRNSFLGSLIFGMAGRIFDFYTQLLAAINLLFPDTATGAFLERWAAIYGFTRNPATTSTGFITATGTATSVIPISTLLTSQAGLEYTTNAEATITDQSISVTTLTRSGTTVTGTTASNHNLASGVDITISGAVETDYNGTVTIAVIALNQFTYDIATTPTTPATGTILADFTTASISVTSSDVGQDVNIGAGGTLSFSSPIAGVDSTTFVQFGEIGGGTDIETDAELSSRMLDRVQNPVALFNVSAIRIQAKRVAGVTRVFIEEITPEVGQVTIYFVRDNDDSIIPTASEVTTVKNKILEIKPAHTSDADVIVLAPTAVPVDFTFTSITPDTSTMRSSIEANLDAYFREDTVVGQDILEAAYQAVIFQTVDISTGDRVTAFALSAPSGDVTVASGEIGTLGTVSF